MSPSSAGPSAWGEAPTVSGRGGLRDGVIGVEGPRFLQRCTTEMCPLIRAGGARPGPLPALPSLWPSPPFSESPELEDQVAPTLDCPGPLSHSQASGVTSASSQMQTLLPQIWGVPVSSSCPAPQDCPSDSTLPLFP